MIFVFRKIVYDSALIHQYESESDYIKDLAVKVYSPDSFELWLTVEYDVYNYVYIPHNGRYYYIDIMEYKLNMIHVRFSCDYGRSFGDVIATDFYIAGESLDGTQVAHIPNGGHILTDTNILYLPRKESVHKLSKGDADKVISLLTSGIIVNFDDFEPETYSPLPPPSEDSTAADSENSEGYTQLSDIDPIELLNQ